MAISFPSKKWSCGSLEEGNNLLLNAKSETLRTRRQQLDDQRKARRCEDRFNSKVWTCKLCIFFRFGVLFVPLQQSAQWENHRNQKHIKHQINGMYMSMQPCLSTLYGVAFCWSLEKLDLEVCVINNLLIDDGYPHCAGPGRGACSASVGGSNNGYWGSSMGMIRMIVSPSGSFHTNSPQPLNAL